jgi:hypothetical protein
MNIDEPNIIDVPHLGVTLRTVLGIAADRMAKTGRRTYTLRYKHMDVGKVNVRPHRT